MSTYDHSRVQQFIGTRLSLFCLVLRPLTLMHQGGNSLDKATISSVHDFVKSNGGHTVITKVCHPQAFVLCFVATKYFLLQGSHRKQW
jgi:acetyl-CoA carboxylase/biotin carboxylase 1